MSNLSYNSDCIYVGKISKGKHNYLDVKNIEPQVN